ncbi:hypothetical protein GGH92_009251 [Coemansia sp. RSA 2673]|nr:hypothetical protein GGH92_009251 [Coemansia sp. RSA 2673]
MVLTTDSAVKAFTHGGNVTLGTNVTVAAGPFGRSAEASGAIINLAPVLSYSKSKGLFAGVSLEGSLIAERKDANAKLYGRPVRAQELLSGVINPPPQADVLYRALDLRATPLSNPSTYGTPGSGSGTPGYGTNTMASTPGVSSPAPLAASSSYLNSSISQTGHTTGAAAAGYGAAPGYGASASTSGYGANAASTGYGANAGTSSGYGANAGTSGYGANAGTSGYGANAGTSSGYGAYAGAAGNGKDRNLETPSALSSAPSAYGADTSTFGAAPPYGAAAAGYKANDESGSNYYTPPAGDTKKRPPPPPPPAPAPANPRAVALYDFAGDQEGDLPFNKGDLITVTEKTESSNDWWKGTCKGRTGNFPSNYVRLD